MVASEVQILTLHLEPLIKAATPVRTWPADLFPTCSTYSHLTSPITSWNKTAEMTSIYSYLESFALKWACNLLQPGQGSPPST